MLSSMIGIVHFRDRLCAWICLCLLVTQFLGGQVPLVEDRVLAEARENFFLPSGRPMQPIER